jgi:hypothetical protein
LDALPPSNGWEASSLPISEIVVSVQPFGTVKLLQLIVPTEPVMDAVPPAPLAETPPVKVEPPAPGWLPSEPHKSVTVFALATPTTIIKTVTKSRIFFIVSFSFSEYNFALQCYVQVRLRRWFLLRRRVPANAPS